MKRVVAKKSVKRTARTLSNKKIVPQSEPVGRILEMKPSRIGMHHGLTLGTIILVLVAVGSLAAVTLEYWKMNAAITSANDANSKLAKAMTQNDDLAQRLKAAETINALSVKNSPKEIVLKEYTSSNLSLNYPVDYTVEKATNNFPVLTIKSDKGRIEIFRMKDFFGGERTVVGSEDTEGDVDGSAPKEQLLVGTDLADSRIQPYNAWLYYETSDDEAKTALEKIAASVKVLR